MKKDDEFAKIKLNNEEITIGYYSMLDHDVMFAYNDRHQKIAKCVFEIIKTFNKTFITKKGQKILSNLSFPYSDTPEKLDIGNKLKIYYGDRVENKEFFLHDRLYKLKSTYCRLDFITLLDESYYKKGVGSALIKTLENFALSKGCEYIKGLYSPSEPFPNGAKKFYERNNYIIQPDGLHPSVIKNLNKEKPLEN